MRRPSVLWGGCRFGVSGHCILGHVAALGVQAEHSPKTAQEVGIYNGRFFSPG